MGKRLLVLIGHGSRSQEWRKPFDALTHDLQATFGEEHVALAFMELDNPRLGEVVKDAVENGAEAISILPMFLSGGGHVKRDIETQVESLRGQYPDVTIEVLVSLGEQPLIGHAIRQLAQDIIGKT
jgi:sirohydrochlorin cobaltochelatase